jgi:hypothetical protein
VELATFLPAGLCCPPPANKAAEGIGIFRRKKKLFPRRDKGKSKASKGSGRFHQGLASVIVGFLLPGNIFSRYREVNRHVACLRLSQKQIRAKKKKEHQLCSAAQNPISNGLSLN